MKNVGLGLFLLVLIVVAGCATVTVPKVRVIEGEQHDTSRTYRANFDQTWEAAIDVMQRYPITTIEKVSGLFITDWVEGTSDTYYAEITGQKQMLQDRTRFNIRVSAVSEGSRVTVNQYIKLYTPGAIVSDPLMGTIGPFYDWQDAVGIKDLPAQTPGRREREILDAIEAKLAAR